MEVCQKFEAGIGSISRIRNLKFIRSYRQIFSRLNKFRTSIKGNPLVTPGNAQLENLAKQIQSITTSITHKEEL